MKILITGGAGFIGSHLVEHFHEKADVVVFDNLTTGLEYNLKGMNCTFIKGDITDAEAISKAAEGCDYIFHLAAFVSVPESLKDPELCNAVNVNGTKNVLDAAANNNVKKVIFSSSCAVYGDSPELPKKESMPVAPNTPYAESKARAEELCRTFTGIGKVSTCIFRFFNVYGPRQDPKSQYAAAIPIFIDKALKDEPISIFGDGKQTRDFIFVEDVVRAFSIAIGKLEGTYNLGSGVETSVNELAEKIVSISGSGSAIEHKPVREGDILRSFGDITLLKSEGFSPAFTLDKGLEDTIGWMREK